MSQRRALVIDRDAAFVESIRRFLGPYGFEIEAVDGGEGLAGRLEPKPALAFIGVELPDRAGFELFSRTKAIAKGLPVILATATVPPSEMAMHQKLSVHADEYLDKRGLAEAQFLGAIDRVVKLGPRVRGWDAKVDGTRVVAAPSQGSSQEGKTAVPAAVAAALRAAGLGADDSAAIAALLAEPARPVATSEPSGKPASVADSPPADGATLATLRATIAGLERDLQAAREVARGSPFSREFLDLREQAERHEMEIVQLKEEAGARAARTEAAERRLRELARALLKASEQHERAARSAQQAVAELQKANGERDQVKGELLRIVQQAEQAGAGAAQQLHKLRAGAAKEVELARATAVRQIDQVRAETARKLEQERSKAARQVEEAQAGAAKGVQEARAQAAAQARRVQDQLAADRAQHAAALKGLQEELRRSQELLAHKERERAEWTARADAAVAAAEERYASELARAHERHLAELEEQRKLQAGLLQRLEEASRRTDAVDLDSKAELSKLREEHALAAAEERRLALSEADKAHHEQMSRIEDELAAARRQVDDLRRKLEERDKRAREDEATMRSLRELIADFSGGLRAHDREGK